MNRLLVVLPSWVGDVVMATPALRALRNAWPEAHLAGLVRTGVAGVLDPCATIDRMIELAPGDSIRRTARRVGAEPFDAAVVLPNSFRSALTVRLAGVRRRVGYARDGRGPLLTDRLRPPRAGRRYTPISAVDYYLALAQHLGAATGDRTMRLDTHPDDERRADVLLSELAPGDGPLVMLNPGGSYGSAKRWPARRYAAVADALIEHHGARVLLNGAPAERAILNEVQAATHHKLVDLPSQGSDLRLLKSLVARCRLMITNDTGPRHFAAALGTPVVTIFGPTDPRWAEIDCEHERQLRVDVFCGPCQLKVCPLDHRCMRRVTVRMVLAAANELIR
ncbi:MAG: lipopolysaccharide heptosyltransferase II [Alphaproteobacteria bacterium]|nr:lipopolysaccharide heptosyltransferase II [Alphaproteobacteria bacterium]